MLRRINISLALIVLICFFLPWVQVSCGGAKDTLSGLDLARHDQTSLWLVPLSMLFILVFVVLRRRNEKPFVASIISIVCSGLTVYLMNDQRMRVQDESGIVSAQLTGWFWLGFISSLAMLITAIGMLPERQRAP